MFAGLVCTTQCVLPRLRPYDQAIRIIRGSSKEVPVFIARHVLTAVKSVVNAVPPLLLACQQRHAVSPQDETKRPREARDFNRVYFTREAVTCSGRLSNRSLFSLQMEAIFLFKHAGAITRYALNVQMGKHGNSCNRHMKIPF